MVTIQLTITLSPLSDHTHPLNQMLYLEGKHFLGDHHLTILIELWCRIFIDGKGKKKGEGGMANVEC